MWIKISCVDYLNSNFLKLSDCLNACEKTLRLTQNGLRKTLKKKTFKIVKQSHILLIWSGPKNYGV